MWLPRWVGELYARLYAEFGGEPFRFEDALNLSRSASAAKVALSELRRVGGVYVHRRGEGGRRAYRLCEPRVLTYIFSGRIFNLDRIKQGRYSRLIGMICAELLKELPGVKSVVVYGSVARGTATEDSDVDLLVIMEGGGSLGKRLDELLRIEFSEEIAKELDWLYGDGIDTHASFLPLSPREAEAFPPALLDVVDEGIPISDDGFYKALAKEKREALSRIGAKRVFVSEGEWYWDLRPGIKPGEVVEL